LRLCRGGISCSRWKLGFPAPPELPPARKSPPGAPHRKVAFPSGRDGSFRGRPRGDPPGTRAVLVGWPGAARMPLGRHADQKIPARRWATQPPPGDERPLKTGFSRNPSRKRARPRHQAGYQDDRSRPSTRFRYRIQTCKANPEESPRRSGHETGTPMYRLDDHPRGARAQDESEIKTKFLVH